MLDFIRQAPGTFANEPEMQEIRAFAAAQAGRAFQAIAEIETLIDLHGPDRRSGLA